MLLRSGYDVEERKIGGSNSWTKQDLLNDVPGARSVPQIIINGEIIGGMVELNKYFALA